MTVGQAMETDLSFRKLQLRVFNTPTYEIVNYPKTLFNAHHKQTTNRTEANEVLKFNWTLSDTYINYPESHNAVVLDRNH